jgi:hypothetical protein
VGKFVLKPKQSKYLSTVHVPCMWNLLSGMNQWEDFSATYCHCLMEPVLQMSCVTVWGSQLQHVIQFLIRLQPILQDIHIWYWKNRMYLLICACWYYRLKFWFQWSHVLPNLRPCTDRSHSNVFEISARYASCSDQEISEKSWDRNEKTANLAMSQLRNSGMNN